MGRVRVAVIGGGANPEHEVSLASAASVAAHLDPAVYEVVRLTIDRTGGWLDEAGRPIGIVGAVAALSTCAVVVPMVHGVAGEDGTLAALCTLIGVPQIGSGVRAGALAMDKWVTKLMAGAVGVATVPGVLLHADDRRRHPWRRPVVVKPVSAGSSLGVGLATTPAAFDRALQQAFALDDRVLVEDLVVGREIDLAVLGRPDGTRRVSPILEIARPPGQIFDHHEKYGGRAEFVIPAPLDDAVARTLRGAAIALYDALGCTGVARVDFFVHDGEVLLNEVNTMPGFTAESQVPQMFAAEGLGYGELLDLLITDALHPTRRCDGIPV